MYNVHIYIYLNYTAATVQMFISDMDSFINQKRYLVLPLRRFEGFGMSVCQPSIKYHIMFLWPIKINSAVIPKMFNHKKNSTSDLVLGKWG